MTALPSGFFGKIPARGDFVRAGLPSSFVAAWDAWFQDAIARSRALLGTEWLPAWLEAPVWRFALDASVCGTDPVLGVWMPSVDRAGRHFPLTLAAVVPGVSADRLAEGGGAWLDAAEQAGLEAVMADATPEWLAGALSEAPCLPDGGAAPFRSDPVALSAGTSQWWTGGSPRVAARRLRISGLPDGTTFAAMLDDRIGGEPQCP
jgi:type VI secretion system protein ImpM